MATYKVMLVEDDNNLRAIYGDRLLAEGYEIVSARDGEEALAMAVKERPDLIISDVMMPKISGFDMLDILRTTPETKDVKVIMMTALSQAEDKARADKLGADKYLVKSQVTLEDVARVVHEVLGDQNDGAVADTSSPAAAAEPTPATADPQSSPAPAEPVATTTPEPTAMPMQPAPEPVVAPTPVPADPVAPATSDSPAAMPASDPSTVQPAPEPVVAPVADSPVSVAPVTPPNDDSSASVTPEPTAMTMQPAPEPVVAPAPVPADPVAPVSPVSTDVPASDTSAVSPAPDATSTTSQDFASSSDASAPSSEMSSTPSGGQRVIQPITPPSDNSQPKIYELYEKEMANEQQNQTQIAATPTEIQPQQPANGQTQNPPTTDPNNFAL